MFDPWEHSQQLQHHAVQLARAVRTVANANQKRFNRFSASVLQSAQLSHRAPQVKVVNAPEPVPKKHESKLPVMSDDEDRGSDGGGGGDDESDGSWDEASIIDGHAWWESGSEDEVCVDFELAGGGALDYAFCPKSMFVVCSWSRRLHCLS